MKCLQWLVAHYDDPAPPAPSDRIELPQFLSEQDLDFIEREVREAHGREDERDKGVQARLIGLLSLSSAITALLSAAAALASSVNIGWSDVVVVLVLIPFTYVAIQTLAVAFFTVRGLKPQRMAKLMPWQSPNEAGSWDRRDRLNRHIGAVAISGWATDRRMDDMKLALEALTRFVWSSAVLLILLLFALLDQRFEFVPDFCQLFCDLVNDEAQ